LNLDISDIIKGKFKLSKYLNRFTLCTFQKKNLINKYQNKYILDFSTVLHADRHSTDLDRHGHDCIVVGITTTYAIGAHHH
jgi:hypothetical protein